MDYMRALGKYKEPALPFGKAGWNASCAAKAAD